MIDILYKDKFLVVCNKPAGIISEATEGRQKNMPQLIKDQIKAYKVDVLHRLDKNVGGLMVFSINQKASASLSKQISGRTFGKEYLAIVKGRPEEDQGEFRDFLFRDKQKNKSFVVKSLRKGAKEAILEYETLKTVKIDRQEYSLVKIKLKTGRTHQIRVQFSSRGMTIMGDRKYGSEFDFKEIALFSHKLSFLHPHTNELKEFILDTPNKYPWNLFK